MEQDGTHLSLLATFDDHSFLNACVLQFMFILVFAVVPLADDIKKLKDLHCLRLG